MADFKVEDILKQAEQINRQIVKHNDENRKQEGFREATKNQIINQINEYNKLYGTNLTIADTEVLQQEYVTAIKDIHSDTKHLQQVLQAIDDNDIKKVMELTGIDIEQDSIKMPVINIDMDEMEKQADKAFKQVEQNNSDIPKVFGLGVEDIEAINEEEVEEEEEWEDEVEEEDDDYVVPDNSKIQSFFQGAKASQQSEASKKENQTAENTVPNFSAMFGQSASKQAEQPKEQEEETSIPNFSSMFSGVKAEPKKEEKEDQSIGSFIQNFKTETKEPAKPNKASDAKIEDALKNQPKIPTFSFGTIDIEEDEE